MKVKMKSKLTAIAISLFMAFMILPAMGEQAYAEGIVEVKKGGDDDNFAADAPIATVRLDRSKFTKKNAALTASGNQNVQDGYELADGKVWAKDCAINANYKNIGGFTLAFPDAAILPDGTRKPVEVVFHDVHVIRKTGAEAYEDDICIARITGDPYAPIAFSPLSSEGK